MGCAVHGGGDRFYPFLGVQMQLKTGMRLASVTDTTQVIVTRATADDVDVRCGGAPMVVAGEAATETAVDPAFSDGTAMGKRYGGDDLPVELLCTKPGPGTLSIGTEPLPLKEAKALPASD
jgi:hypothetical protein